MQQSPYTGEPVYVDSDAQLRACCARWQDLPALALDTEFIRTDTFYPIGALIQVSDGSDCYLIDPLTITDFSPFVALLEAPAITKVLHSCSEDLEVFERLFGVLPRPVFDTQVAAALAGHGFSLSYQALTELMLAIHVPKGETRSNWLQRPLSAAQIHYAALDVAYLPVIYQQLRAALDAQGRLSWLEEEGDQLLANYRENSRADQYYRRIKAAWRLSGEQLERLRRLATWREQTARERDRPRGRILKDKSCLEIARSCLRHSRELAAIEEVGPKTVRQYGDRILALLNEPVSDSELPEPLPGPLPGRVRELEKALKARVGERAEQLQVARELLARNRDYEALIRSGLEQGEYRLPASLSGWRKAVIGDELLALAQRY